MNNSIDISRLEKKIGYSFSDKELLKNALTHSSYANENKLQSNERLEFLGDSVLGLICSEYLYKKYRNRAEGGLSKIRAALVCENALDIYAQEISLPEYLLLGKGEEHTGGRKRASVIADAYEALIGAMFLDGGTEPVKKFVLPVLKAHTSAADIGETFKDYKSILQEIVQKNPGEILDYVLANETGPDHNKTFVCEVHLNSNVITSGTGKSKKDAQQDAAKKVLELMGIEK